MEILFKAAYEDYKMLNLLIVFVDHQFVKHVTSFNPFKLNVKSLRGEFW